MPFPVQPTKGVEEFLCQRGVLDITIQTCHPVGGTCPCIEVGQPKEPTPSFAAGFVISWI